MAARPHPRHLDDDVHNNVDDNLHNHHNHHNRRPLYRKLRVDLECRHTEVGPDILQLWNRVRVYRTGILPAGPERLQLHGNAVLRILLRCRCSELHRDHHITRAGMFHHDHRRPRRMHTDPLHTVSLVLPSGDLPVAEDI